MKALPAPFAQKAVLSLLYVALVLVYCALYAPFGLENNDGGFILGLAHQFSEGARLYEEIIYVRPPASVIFHSISFARPLDLAPILSSRIVYFLQIGVYSAVAAVLFARHFNFSAKNALLLASACFIFNTHNFPPMAWHTVDGVFFSVTALFFAAISKNGAAKIIFLKAFLAFLLAFAAALSKQPYYITPMLVGLVLIYPFSVRRVIIVMMAATAGGMLVYSALASQLNITQMLDAMSSQTSLRDLIAAGVVNYARDWHDQRALATAGPLAIVLLIWAYGRVRKNAVEAPVYLQVALVCSIAAYLASMLQMFLMTDRWVSPTSLIDSIFTVTAVISFIETIRTRERIWLILTALHGISWAASISWGYTTVALFSAPSIIVITIAASEIFEKRKFTQILSVIAVFSAAAIFFIGNQFLYSLDVPVRRADASVSLGSEFPALTGVRVTQTQADALRDLATLRSRLGSNIVVMPNWPLYNTIFGGINPIGIDWLLNTEVGPFEKTVVSRLEQVDFALVFRNASSSPSSKGRFGSQITQSVMQTWVLEDQDAQYFQVYSNPLR